MADRFYGVAIGGQHAKDVTEGAASGGAAAPVELRVSDTAYGNKLLVRQALVGILEYLDTKEGNPIT